jgi:hypothetical protein
MALNEEEQEEKRVTEALRTIDEINTYSASQFDKNILYIASGSLGVSFAFIKDIIPSLEKAISKHYLIASWIIFSAIIFLSLISHYLSIQATNSLRKDYKCLADTKRYNKKIKPWNFAIKTINIICIFSIFIGSLYLFYFIQKNILL